MNRFPRLRCSKEELNRISQLLRATYNRLIRTRNLRWGRLYDIYKTKRGESARKYFPILADRLILDHIDPSLYLKVLSKYGIYEETGFLPHPKWLAGNKAKVAFGKVLLATRKRFNSEEEWKSFLTRAQRTNPRGIAKGIRISWDVIHEVMKIWETDIENAIFVQFDLLSPWFLAICPEFLGMKGLQLLKPRFRKEVRHCMRYFLYNRQAFKEAIKTYRKLERMTFH